MNLKKLLEMRSQKQAEMKEIIKKADTEERTLNTEELEQFEKLEKEIKDIDATVAAIQAERNLTIVDDGDDPDDDKKEENVEEREIKAFENFVRNNIEELRAGEIQLTQGQNGSIVPTTIANRIIKAVRDKVPYLMLADVVNTNGKLSVPVYGEDSTNFIKADYVDEGNALTDNIGKFTTIDLTGFVIGALSLVSNKLISNTDINITDFVVNEVSEAMAEKLEKEFTVGTEGKITGIISGPVKVTTQSNSAITYDELVSLKHSLKKAFRGAGKWIMNDSTYTALCKLKDGNGQPYFKEDEYKILDCEVLPSDSMPEIGASNKPIVFTDLSGYTIKATKAVEIQLLREKYADRNMLGVIAYGEYDGKITDAKKVAVMQMHA